MKKFEIKKSLRGKGKRREARDIVRGAGEAAFTLAEVLITLGIIGVVAAITIPTLVQNYRQHVVETRLQKFYTTFNQAITMAEAQYGDKKEWYWDAYGVELDKDGNPIEGTSKVDQWFNKYLSQFITIKKKVDKTGYVLYYLPDGSAFSLGVAGQPSLRDMRFYPGDPERCTGERILTSGTCSFGFEYYPISTSPSWRFLYNKGLEPSKFEWDGTLNDLYNDMERGCAHYGQSNGAYCTALIQSNGWKIPKDYPRKVRY